MRARKHRSGRTYYYLDLGGKPRKEIPLGPDYVIAVQKWADHNKAPQLPSSITLSYVAKRYFDEIVPTKAEVTRRNNAQELKQLLYYFDQDKKQPLDKIEPFHIRQFLDWRGQKAKTRANREKALFSHMWNYARNKGFTTKPNPCMGIAGFKEEGRTIYLETPVYQVIYKHADRPLQDAMDLAYLIGQRPSDVRKRKFSDIKDGAIEIRQGKTKHPLRVKIEGKLEALINRFKARPIASFYMISDDAGKPLGRDALRYRFDKARDRAVISLLQMGNKELAEAVKASVFSDLRSKAGTDVANKRGMLAAQQLLGHKHYQTTQRYVRARKGDLVDPTE